MIFTSMSIFSVYCNNFKLKTLEFVVVYLLVYLSIAIHYPMLTLVSE